MANSFGSGFSSGLQLGELASKMRDRRDAKQAQKLDLIRKRVDTWQGLLTEAYMLDDPESVESTVQSIAEDYKSVTGKQMGKNFQQFIKDPEKAFEVLKTIREGGQDAVAFFDLADEPILLGGAVLAMAKAKREREARRIGSGGEPATTPSATPSAPRSFASAPARDEPDTGVESRSVTPAADQVEEVSFDRMARPAVAPAPVPGIEQQPGSEVRGAVARTAEQLRRDVAQKQLQISELRRLGRDTKDIQPHVQELNSMRDQLIKLETAPELAAQTKEAEQAVMPPDLNEVMEAREQLIEAGKHELANRLRPNMNRRSFDAVMAQVGPTGTSRQPAPGTPGALPQAQPRPKSQAEREASKVQTRETIEGTQRVAFKQYEDYVKKGDEARRKENSYRTLIDALERSGPTGAFRGPIRQQFFNFAQMFGFEAESLANIQTAEAASRWLSTAVLRDFSGPDSDRDFLRAMEQNPDIRKSPNANRLLAALALQETHRDRLRAANANKWVGIYGSLANKDEAGNNFNQWWERFAEAKAPYLTIEMLQQAGIDPDKVWKKGRR